MVPSFKQMSIVCFLPVILYRFDLNPRLSDESVCEEQANFLENLRVTLK
jgi:hypothetical protein